jgi:hypothetical protein
LAGRCVNQINRHWVRAICACIRKRKAYFAMHDFSFYRIEPVRIRFIGGFGKIHWVEPEQYLLPVCSGRSGRGHPGTYE